MKEGRLLVSDDAVYEDSYPHPECNQFGLPRYSDEYVVQPSVDLGSLSALRHCNSTIFACYMLNRRVMDVPLFSAVRRFCTVRFSVRSGSGALLVKYTYLCLLLHLALADSPSSNVL